MCLYALAQLNGFNFIHQIEFQNNAVCMYVSMHGIANPAQFYRFFRRQRLSNATNGDIHVQWYEVFRILLYFKFDVWKSNLPDIECLKIQFLTILFGKIHTKNGSACVSLQKAVNDRLVTIFVSFKRFESSPSRLSESHCVHGSNTIKRRHL